MYNTQYYVNTCSSVWEWNLGSKIYDILGMADMFVHGSNNSLTLRSPDLPNRSKKNE